MTRHFFLFLPLALWLIAQTTLANPTLDPDVTTSTMESILEGPGISIAPGSLTAPLGESYQFGSVTDGHIPSGPGPILNIDRGIFMVTGETASIPGPNNAANTTTSSGVNAADPQLTSVNPSATFDPVVLQLEVTPDAQYLKFLFVFGSDEYPEYVCSVYNDAFGFFIKPTNSSTWQNVALVPGTTQPIAVNTINNGSCGSSGSGVSSDLGNSAYYVDNGTGNTPATNANLQYDGFTIPMIVEVPVTPGQAYDVKLAIADVGDASYDSAVFIKWIMASDFLTDADLALDLAVDDLDTTIGDTVTFTLSVSNQGPDSVTGVESAFSLPAGFTYLADDSGGNYDHSNGVWSVPGTLAAGSTQAIEVTAIAGGPAAVIDVFAEITAMNAADEDSLAGNGPQTPAEDDESSISLNVEPAPDLSDAPITGTSYGVASHSQPSLLLIGNLLNGDITSPANADATGDTSDDGVTFTAFEQGSSTLIPVQVNGSGGYLQAWIDWDGNGNFTDAGDAIAVNVQDGGTGDTDGIANGIITLQTSVPAVTTSTPTFARFRWSSELSTGPDGVAGDGEVEDYQISIGGITLAGQLFIDNGDSGGIAHDGLVNGSEETGAIGSIQILAVSDGSILALASVDQTGNWHATLSPGFSGDVQIQTTPEAPYVTISESVGTLPITTNSSAHDGIIIANVTTGQNYSGVNFGVVRPPELQYDESATIEPGDHIVLEHQYHAHTSGAVSFALTNLVSQPAGEFSATLYRDTLCNGSAATTSVSAVSVAAGDRVCLRVHVYAASTITSGARYRFTLTATTDYESATLTNVQSNEDIVTFTSERLELSKRVRNLTDGTPEGVLNTANTGDTLEYKLIIRNASAGPTTELTVNDTTPAWTALAEPIATPVTLAGGVTCVVTTPNSIGYEGPIEWVCSGSFPPGEEATLQFRVTVQ